MKTRAPRVQPQEVFHEMHSGNGPLLVCAYADDRKFEQIALEGAIPFRQFLKKEATLSKEREIVFY